MQKWIGTLLLLAVAWAGYGQEKFDVVIYGGTAAGYASAIQVARLGKTVALLEPSAHIGGNVVEGLGGADIDNHKEFRNSPAVSGIALEFYRRVADVYGRREAFEKMLSEKRKDPGLWRMESKVAEKVIADWLAEHKVPVFKNTALAESADAVKKINAKITQIRSVDGRTFSAAVFIDATIEGDLLAAAGISTVVGRESNSTYGETLNGIRGETTHAQFSVRVDPYRIPGDAKSGLIPTIQDEPLGKPGEGDDHLQAFCFRVCLTKNQNNRLPFYKPEGYQRSEYEIYIRYLKAGGKLYTPHANLPNEKTDLGAWHDLSHNLYGMNKAYPLGSYTKRKDILDYHATFTKGLFYFLSTDPEVATLAPQLQQEWARWGYAKDEFPDNNHFPRMFYVRDARRMVSDYVVTQHHVKRKNPTPVEDPVCIAYWPTDVHSVRRIVRDGAAYNEGFVFGGDYWRPLPVSYRSMVPKKAECINLITPTCISSSHIAYGAVRIEWTFMLLGQAAGVAAALSIDQKLPVQNLKYQLLSNQLKQFKVVLDHRQVGAPE
ncbi:FAD-dependent oxidoreductase [Dyadobacter aurulentus]|uniref:FAD-dependent oxidoreductase n=1 Tax=Dyadobacter sp. UC 10 TaxID=2605428 RepID=UPI0011F105FE|nr:FAD-dependent oxidoreductase [Dyadobacter sp. UC 10]KAA0992307.1 FAD-dependent oxidoreductase [Dyadobacter sp. UC 10]